MTPEELRDVSKLLKWAEDSTSELHFAFGVSANEGVLVLNRRTKGRSLMHDLVQSDGHRDLRSERYGTAVIAGTSIKFVPNKTFDTSGTRHLKKVLKQTSAKEHELEFAGNLDEGEV